ncbi:hypothetical protein ZWY2020_054503 [Hordeum vulgare]|nr:hypothetical protein ZWY2020_054503 [Hordeum vulgare]
MPRSPARRRLSARSGEGMGRGARNSEIQSDMALRRQVTYPSVALVGLAARPCLSHPTPRSGSSTIRPPTTHRGAASGTPGERRAWQEEEDHEEAAWDRRLARMSGEAANTEDQVGHDKEAGPAQCEEELFAAKFHSLWNRFYAGCGVTFDQTSKPPPCPVTSLD